MSSACACLIQCGWCLPAAGYCLFCPCSGKLDAASSITCKIHIWYRSCSTESLFHGPGSADSWFYSSAAIGKANHNSCEPGLVRTWSHANRDSCEPGLMGTGIPANRDSGELGLRRTGIPANRDSTFSMLCPEPSWSLFGKAWSEPEFRNPPLTWPLNQCLRNS